MYAVIATAYFVGWACASSWLLRRMTICEPPPTGVPREGCNSRYGGSPWHGREYCAEWCGVDCWNGAYITNWKPDPMRHLIKAFALALLWPIAWIPALPYWLATRKPLPSQIVKQNTDLQAEIDRLEKELSIK